jgi:Cu/Ag efflux protein CusF
MSMSPYPPPNGPARPRAHRRGLAIGAGILAGAAAGAVIATAVGATAASSATGSGQTASSVSAAAPDSDPGCGNHLPWTSGTVTAVGSNSVTIKTSSGTATYGVTSASDIDKNGEAQLRDLKVGDAVRFSTQTVNGATIIDKLHAGDEAKDRPAAPPSGPTDG